MQNNLPQFRLPAVTAHDLDLNCPIRCDMMASSDWSPKWVGDTFNAEKMCQYNYVSDGNVLIYAQ